MKVEVTYDPPQGGEDFHVQKLYYVPEETAQAMVSDFVAFQDGGDGQACQTYEYALINGRSETGDAEEQSGREAEERSGIVALDFRKVASIHGFDPVS